MILYFLCLNLSSQETIVELEEMEKELCEHMGFGNRHSVVDKDYSEWSDYFDLYGGEELGHKHEEEMCKRWQGRVCMIKNFPNSTSPFWNMRAEWRWYSSQDRCYYIRTRKLLVLLNEKFRSQ